MEFSSAWLDADLDALNFAFRHPTPVAARTIIAPILRRWLSENLLVSLERQENKVSYFAKNPWGDYSGTMVLPGFDLSEPLSWWMRRIMGDGNPPVPESALEYEAKKDFIGSPVAIYKNVSLLRRDIVRFLCNKMGGVHMDPNNWTEKQNIIYEMHCSMSLHGRSTEPKLLIDRSFPSQERQGNFDLASLCLFSTAEKFCGMKLQDRLVKD